jgi:hypothetical protein
VLGLNVRLRDFPRAVADAVLSTDARLGVTKQGFAVDPAQEFTEALTGVKSLKPRVNRVLYYSGARSCTKCQRLSRNFNQVAKQRGSVDAEKITQAYITANEQRFKALRDLNMAIEDAKTLGLSTAEIVKPLKRCKNSKLKSFSWQVGSMHSSQAQKPYRLLCKARRQACEPNRLRSN